MLTIGVVQIHFQVMEVETGQGQPDDARATKAAKLDSGEEQLVFLYRLVDGRSTNSYGRLCARLAGIPAPVRTLTV